MSERRSFQEAVIGCGAPFFGKKGHARFLKELHQIMPLCAGVRRYGSAALDLAYVAAGRFDGFWERDLKPWDIAAGIVLVREAGGFAGSIADTGDVLETGDIAAGNEHILAELKARLAKAA